MPRKTRTPKPRRVLNIDEVQAYVFEHGKVPPPDERPSYTGSYFAAYMTSYASLAGPCRRFDRLQDVWNEHRDAFLADWIRERPGTRPYAWWLLDAPREQFNGRGKRGPEPLQQVGGSGRPIRLGVYASDIALACGRVPFEANDPANPPLVESEAAYLKRHDLLLPGERHRLTADDFEPIAADGEDDEDEDRRAE